MQLIKAILDYNLFTINHVKIHISNIAAIVFLLILIKILVFIIKKSVYRTKQFDEGKKYAIIQLIKYIAYTSFIIVSLDLIGINISLFLAGSAALLVGIGLGLQNLFNDFVSGMIILIDGSIKVNDIIEVNGIVAKVNEIKLRTTTVLTRDDKYIILPNSTLTSKDLINWTHHAEASRFEINIKVAYNSPVDLIRKLLLHSADLHPLVLKNPKPFIRLIEFGDSGLIFTLFFWTEEVFRVENVKSDLRIYIFQLLKENNVEIPYPKTDIYLKS
jgi:small-conductance mechanosensitive channel